MISGAEIASFPITIIFPSGNRILSSVYPSSLILYKYTDMLAHSNIQTCWHIQIYRHVGTLKYTDMLAHLNIQTCWHKYTDMLAHSNIQTCWHKYTDMLAHSSIQTCWHIQIYRHVGTFKYTDMLAHSNKQITDMLLNISKLDNSRTNKL